MENDAIIFDIDGTLWNACAATAKGWNDGLEKLGIKKIIFPLQIENLAGKTQEEAVNILFPGLYGTYPNLVETLDICESDAIRTQGGMFYGGVIDGIKKLASHYKIFIVSNCTDWYVRVFLDFSKFEPVISGFDCNGMSGLPKNEMLARMRKDFSLENPVYVGDTASDEEATRSAGMDFVYVSYGFGKPKGNPKTFDSFADLVGYFTENMSRNMVKTVAVK
ncbi:MAG: HAD-IA family hydrolase [Candidatus Paceibacterota bacterium]